MSASPYHEGRLERAFKRRRKGDTPGVIPYFTAGYPRLDDLPALLHAAEGTGCLAAEVGVPFSDPVADGPTMPQSSHIAIGNGIHLALIFEQIATARSSGLGIPVVLMTHVNPVLAYGFDRFFESAAGAGADGVIVPDLPLGEAGGLRQAADKHDLPVIPLVTPVTTPGRLQRTCVHARGFISCVSVAGTTGARAEISKGALDLLERVGMVTDTPRALGFGLREHRHLISLTGRCEAAVIGSAVIDAIDADREHPVHAASTFLHALRHG